MLLEHFYPPLDSTTKPGNAGRIVVRFSHFLYLYTYIQIMYIYICVFACVCVRVGGSWYASHFLYLCLYIDMYKRYLVYIHYQFEC